MRKKFFFSCELENMPFGTILWNEDMDHARIEILPGETTGLVPVEEDGTRLSEFTKGEFKTFRSIRLNEMDLRSQFKIVRLGSTRKVLSDYLVYVPMGTIFKIEDCVYGRKTRKKDGTVGLQPVRWNGSEIQRFPTGRLCSRTFVMQSDVPDGMELKIHGVLSRDLWILPKGTMVHNEDQGYARIGVTETGMSALIPVDENGEELEQFPFKPFAPYTSIRLVEIRSDMRWFVTNPKTDKEAK